MMSHQSRTRESYVLLDKSHENKIQLDKYMLHFWSQTSRPITVNYCAQEESKLYLPYGSGILRSSRVYVKMRPLKFDKMYDHQDQAIDRESKVYDRIEDQFEVRSTILVIIHTILKVKFTISEIKYTILKIRSERNTIDRI